MAEDFAIKIENVKKQYKLGAIGGGTLTGDLQSWWARVRGKEDPNLQIGQDYSKMGERFMALDGVSFTVNKGEAVGIIGANGAGKSTLLKILSRVTAPTDGDIWIDGRVASMLEVGTGFHPEMTGRENIYMNGAVLGMTRKEVDAKIESIIDFSECRQFIDTPVKRYSSGMYVKLAFAVASHLDAEIMIMDEVLAVGDMKFQKKCLGKMGDEAKGGKTVLYVSHNMATIRNLCSRCIVLSHGKVIFDGGVEDAIDVYMGETKGDLKTCYDFQSHNRKNFDAGGIVRIKKIVFPNRDMNVFMLSEKMVFRVFWEAVTDFKDVYLRYTVNANDETPVGITYSDKPFCGKKGEEYFTDFSFDVSNFSEGLYYFFLAFSTMEGIVNDIDWLEEEKIYFELINDIRKFQWKKGWGKIELQNLVVCKVEQIGGNNETL